MTVMTMVVTIKLYKSYVKHIKLKLKWLEMKLGIFIL